jgi:hypothetical protein
LKAMRLTGRGLSSSVISVLCLLLPWSDIFWGYL